MAIKKETDLYICDECGMVVSVVDPCGCGTCELICCDVPMKKKAARKKKAAPRAGAAGKKAKAAGK